jgi:PAS domain S-box-containing protein
MNSTSTDCKLRIVHFEDRPQDRELIAERLAAEGLACEFTYAKTKAELEAALGQRDLELILCDYSVPSFCGSEALTLARRLRPDTPFIFVSGTIGEERAVESLRSGATDYVLKDHLERLSLVVRRALHEARTQRQQRQAEEAVRASEHKYRQLFENLGDAAFLIGEDTGEILDTNSQAESLLGRSRAEILGRVEEALYARTSEPAPGRRPVALACETRGGCEALVLGKDGTEVPVHVCASGLELHGRRLFLALFRDLTERKQLERQLLRAQRLESIGTLASGVAHDLNNILAPVMMATSILSHEVESPWSRAVLATLETCARRGADVIRQLATFAKGLEGKKCLFQPRHLLKEIAKILAETFPRSIAVSCQAPSDLWAVSSVPTQIHQVLLNLAVNAREAMADAGRLELAAENVRLDEAAARLMPGANAGPYVQFRVADTGTGIAPEIVDRIFDPFFSTKRPGKGTGLGLSSVMGIVKSHGGFIQLTTQPGQGTEFRVYLPASVGKETVPSSPAAPPLFHGRGEMILIVDDEDAMCSVMQHTLETNGYRTLIAHNGAEAVALYLNRGLEIGLVLTDLDMPALGGRAAAAALLTMNPQVKIVVVTGLEAPPASASGGPAGYRAVLKKPCPSGLLLQTVDQVLHAEPRTLEHVL